MFLPVMALMPQKFAICFTLGCIFIVGSFFALKGPKAQLLHMISKEVRRDHFAFLSDTAITIEKLSQTVNQLLFSDSFLLSYLRQ
jgi:hypothetical protein